MIIAWASVLILAAVVMVVVGWLINERDHKLRAHIARHEYLLYDRHSEFAEWPPFNDGCPHCLIEVRHG